MNEQTNIKLLNWPVRQCAGAPVLYSQLDNHQFALKTLQRQVTLLITLGKVGVSLFSDSWRSVSTASCHRQLNRTSGVPANIVLTGRAIHTDSTVCHTNCKQHKQPTTTQQTAHNHPTTSPLPPNKQPTQPPNNCAVLG
jgi:hypothetical protein